MPVPLSEWESSYLMAGCAGAALTGLMFVVIAPAADGMMTTPSDGVGAFSTPTVGRFAIAHQLSSITSVPVHALLSLGACVGGSAWVASSPWTPAACACDGSRHIRPSSRTGPGTSGCRSSRARRCWPPSWVPWLAPVMVAVIVMGCASSASTMGGTSRSTS
jgi:hypothetical protein